MTFLQMLVSHFRQEGNDRDERPKVNSKEREKEREEDGEEDESRQMRALMAEGVTERLADEVKRRSRGSLFAKCNLSRAV